jgi:hypothetical protein
MDDVGTSFVQIAMSFWRASQPLAYLVKSVHVYAVRQSSSLETCIHFVVAYNVFIVYYHLIIIFVMLRRHLSLRFLTDVDFQMLFIQ